MIARFVAALTETIIAIASTPDRTETMIAIGRGLIA